MWGLIASGLVSATLTLLPAQSPYVITGQVGDEAGRAVGRVRVCAYAADFDSRKPDQGIPCGFSDARGAFSIAVSKASRYRLFYSAHETGYWSPYLPFFRHPSAPAPEVSLDEAHTRASVTILMLPKNGLLVGKSVDLTTGLPVESVEFILCHAADSRTCWSTSVKNSGGDFTIPAPHVPFILRIKAGGFDDWLGPNGENREESIYVAPETKAELAVFLKRSGASAGEAIGEAEKREGVHLPAPVQLSPANETVYDHFPRQTKLEWSPVEGATSYAVEVDYCAGGYGNRQRCANPQPLRLAGSQPTSGIPGHTYEFNFIGAQPGRWRVWAVDREGREGFKSPWRRFVYLR